MQPIGIFAEPQANSVTFSLPNSFTEANYDQLICAVEPFLQGYERFVIDLSHTDRIDTVVLGCFLVLKEKIQASKGEVVLLNPHGMTMQMLERANFSQLFQVEFSDLSYDI